MNQEEMLIAEERAMFLDELKGLFPSITVDGIYHVISAQDVRHSEPIKLDRTSLAVDIGFVRTYLADKSMLRERLKKVYQIASEGDAAYTCAALRELFDDLRMNGLVNPKKNPETQNE